MAKYITIKLPFKVFHSFSLTLFERQFKTCINDVYKYLNDRESFSYYNPTMDVSNKICYVMYPYNKIGAAISVKLYERQYLTAFKGFMCFCKELHAAIYTRLFPCN